MSELQQAPQTIDDHHSVILEGYAKQANEHYEDSLITKRKCQDAFGDHVKNVLLCGKSLNDAKATEGHGEWGEWLKTYCPKIDRETARRWMRLAENASEIDFSDCKSMNQVYRVAGLLPESNYSSDCKTATADSGGTQVFNFKPIANGAHVLIRAAEKPELILNLPPEDQDSLRIALQNGAQAIGVMLAVLNGEDITSDSQILNPEEN